MVVIESFLVRKKPYIPYFSIATKIKLLPNFCSSRPQFVPTEFTFGSATSAYIGPTMWPWAACTEAGWATTRGDRPAIRLSHQQHWRCPQHQDGEYLHLTARVACQHRGSFFRSHCRKIGAGKRRNTATLIHSTGVVPLRINSEKSSFGTMIHNAYKRL